MIWYSNKVVHLRHSFNTLCLRFFHAENILLGSIKVLLRMNEIHRMKDVDPHQKVHLL